MPTSPGTDTCPSVWPTVTATSWFAARRRSWTIRRSPRRTFGGSPFATTAPPAARSRRKTPSARKRGSAIGCRWTTSPCTASTEMTRVLALAGGVGGAKLAQGLYQVLPPRALTVLVNTADDFVIHGLHVS